MYAKNKESWEKKSIIIRMNQAKLYLVNCKQSYKTTAVNDILLENCVQNSQSSKSTSRLLLNSFYNCVLSYECLNILEKTSAGKNETLKIS